MSAPPPAYPPQGAGGYQPSGQNQAYFFNEKTQQWEAPEQKQQQGGKGNNNSTPQHQHNQNQYYSAQYYQQQQAGMYYQQQQQYWQQPPPAWAVAPPAPPAPPPAPPQWKELEQERKKNWLPSTGGGGKNNAGGTQKQKNSSTEAGGPPAYGYQAPPPPPPAWKDHPLIQDFNHLFEEAGALKKISGVAHGTINGKSFTRAMDMRARIGQVLVEQLRFMFGVWIYDLNALEYLIHAYPGSPSRLCYDCTRLEFSKNPPVVARKDLSSLMNKSGGAINWIYAKTKSEYLGANDEQDNFTWTHDARHMLRAIPWAVAEMEIDKEVKRPIQNSELDIEHALSACWHNDPCSRLGLFGTNGAELKNFTRSEWLSVAGLLKNVEQFLGLLWDLVESQAVNFDNVKAEVENQKKISDEAIRRLGEATDGMQRIWYRAAVESTADEVGESPLTLTPSHPPGLTPGKSLDDARLLPIAYGICPETDTTKGHIRCLPMDMQPQNSFGKTADDVAEFSSVIPSENYPCHPPALYIKGAHSNYTLVDPLGQTNIGLFRYVEELFGLCLLDLLRRIFTEGDPRLKSKYAKGRYIKTHVWDYDMNNGTGDWVSQDMKIETADQLLGVLSMNPDEVIKDPANLYTGVCNLIGSMIKNEPVGYGWLQFAHGFFSARPEKFKKQVVQTRAKYRLECLAGITKTLSASFSKIDFEPVMDEYKKLFTMGSNFDNARAKMIMLARAPAEVIFRGEGMTKDLVFKTLVSSIESKIAKPVTPEEKKQYTQIKELLMLRQQMLHEHDMRNTPMTPGTTPGGGSRGYGLPILPSSSHALPPAATSTAH